MVLNDDWVTLEEAELWEGGVDYQVFSIDPGGTTGWSIFQVHSDAMSGDPDIRLLNNVQWWTAGQLSGKQDDQIDALVDMIQHWPNARLVTEDFKLRQMNALLDPVEINAALRWALRPRYFVKQHASLAMSTVTDDRQKEWGFWLPGQEHARDAIKHNITFLKRMRERAMAALRSAE